MMHFTQQQIIFEDVYLMVANKPNGLVSESDNPAVVSAQNAALQYLKNKTPYPDQCFAAVAHRLDAPVSGAILVAKKRSILKIFSAGFEQQKLNKTYLALVENAPPQQSQHLQHFHIKNNEQRKALISNKQLPGSKPAALEYTVLANMQGVSLLQVKLISGRYHQIRAQLAFIGCPIVGDAHYGAATLYSPHAIGLHAYNLKFEHPVTAEAVNVTAPPPPHPLWQLFNNVLAV